MIDRLLGRADDGVAYDAAEPWEGPGNDEDLRAYSARRLGSYAHRPSAPEDVPERSLEALRAALGTLSHENLVILPRTPRVTGAGDRMWAVTPTSVLAVGDAAVALWVDRPAPGVVAMLAYDEVAAIVDRTILLLGRLEIIGADRSIVVRYNTVGRALMRRAIVAIRRSFWPPDLPPAATGMRAEQLPHKWMALLRSADMQPNGPDRLLAAAGALDDPREAHDGIAAVSSTELLIATEPAAPEGLGHYGVDLVVLPRRRIASLEVEDASVVATINAGGRQVRVPIAVSPSLADAVATTLVPAIAGRP